jgi:F-type H+-transporting ATPase subunit b
MMTDPTFWVFCALMAFVAIVVVAKVPALIAQKLDDRSIAISATLAEAAKLKADAEALLATYKAKQVAAEQQAKDIVEAAVAEAARLRESAASQIEKSIKLRTAQAERKIAQAEAQAMAEVRAAAADLAATTAERVFSAQLDGKDADRLIADAIAEVPGKFAHV